MPGPAPCRPIVETALPPFSSKSRIGAFRIDLNWRVCPAAAVPVSVKMPEPITAPTPKAVRVQGPSVLRRRLSGSSEALIRASMLLVRNNWLNGLYRKLPLTLPLHHLFNFLLHRPARHARRALGLRRRFLARRPL